MFIEIENKKLKNNVIHFNQVYVSIRSCFVFTLFLLQIDLLFLRTRLD